MSEAFAPAPIEAAVPLPVQETIFPIDQIKRVEDASKRVLGGVVTEGFDTFKSRTEGSFSDFLKAKVGSTVDRLRHDLPEVAGMTVYGSAGRGEAQHQKENGLSSDIDGTILIDVDKNPQLSEKVIRSDSLYMGVAKGQFDSLRMDMDYTMALSAALDPSIREVTGRNRNGAEVTNAGDTVNEHDDIEIRPISELIIVEQIEAMCETAKARKDLREQGVTDLDQLPFFASRNIRALFQPSISGDLSSYTDKAIEAFKAMELVYGAEVRDTAWAMHARGVNTFHDGRNPNATPLIEEDFSKYIAEQSKPEILGKTTTSNGHEINHPREQLGAGEFKDMVNQYGIGGENPKQRAESLKKLPPEHIALFLADLNRRLQGSDETLVSEKVMKIGDKNTIDPEHRYDLFIDLIKKIESSGDINPERIGDTLAIGAVLLHAFEDGNGRTARTIGLLFRDDFDAEDYADTFKQLVEPRDVARKRGGFRISGFTPYMGEGVDQSDPRQVGEYFDKLLTSDDNLYTSPYGQATLHAKS